MDAKATGKVSAKENLDVYVENPVVSEEVQKEIKANFSEAKQKQFTAFKLNALELVDRCASLASESIPRQLRDITTCLEDLIPKLRTFSVMGGKIILDKIQNELVSIQEGLLSGAIKGVTPTTITALTTLVKSVEEKISSQHEKARDDSFSDESLNTAQKVFNTKHSKLPALGKDTPFKIAKGAITFTAKGKVFSQPTFMVNVEKLNRLGFKSSIFEGYCVIENQTLLGISNASIPTKEVGKKVGEGKTFVEKKKTKTSFDVAKEVLKSIIQKTGKHWMFVSSEPNPVSGGNWFWIIPEADLQLLQSVNRKFPSWGVF